MGLNLTEEQWAEVFDHLTAIQESLDRMHADNCEMRACMDRIIAMKAAPQECQE